MQQSKRVCGVMAFVIAAGMCVSVQAQPVPAKGGAQPVPNAGQPVVPPGTTPTDLPGTDLGTPPEGDMVTFSAFAEPVELTALVDYVAKALNANITIKGALAGQVVFNAPVSVPKSKLIQLLSSLLEQQNFTLTYDAASQFYSVVGANDISLNLSGELPTTRVFSTPSLRPSSLQTSIAQQLGGVQGQVLKISPIDEMGVIVVTDTPKRLAAVETLIKSLLEEYGKAKFTRLELNHISGSVARERILQLLGQIAQPRSGNDGQPQQPQQPNAQGGGGKLESIGDRLTVDPQGNAMIFRGQPLELEQVRSIVTVIDVPNTLVPKQYFAGSSSRQIADIARNRGLGEVLIIAAPQSGFGNFDFNGFDQNNRGQQGRSTSTGAGGPIMVVDEAKGNIIYYGTDAQQEQLASLIDGLNLKEEQIVIRNYKLRNADAEKVADLVLGLIQNRTPEGSDSPLLPGGNQGRSGFNLGGQPNTIFITPPDGGSGELSLGAGDNVFVLADKANNQLLVKGPVRQQDDYKKLIEKLDVRRPQVYIEAKIIAVTWTDDLKLAFESQLINSGGTGGVLNTNFGLGSFGTGAITTPKTVGTGNLGATLALIKSDQVPIIMNALSRKVDARILATPQLLVDDNEEGILNSIDKQPYATTTQGTSTTLSSYGGDSEAGTIFKVTPQISEGGYLRLKYEAELSSFTGAATAGLPPPSQVNKISADSVTVPSDFTVVVGGLTFESKTETKNRVPWLGEIPIIGALFGSTDNQNRKTTLYIFITPRIFRDDAFADSRLNTEGPQASVKLEETLPKLKPSIMEVTTPAASFPAPLDADVGPTSGGSR